MANKKKCPHFSARRNGKWIAMVCTLPAGKICPNPHCQANPEYQESDQDENE